MAKVMIEKKLFVDFYVRINNSNGNNKKENKNATTTIVHIWGGWVKSKLHCLKWTEEVKDRSSSPMAWTNTKRKIEMRDTLRVCLCVCVCEWVSVWVCELEAIFWRVLMLVAFGFCLEMEEKKTQRKKTDSGWMYFLLQVSLCMYVK